MLQKPVSVKCQAKGNCVTDCLWHSLFLMLKGFQYSLSQAHTVTDYNNCNFYQQIYIWGNTVKIQAVHSTNRTAVQKELIQLQFQIQQLTTFKPNL